MRAEKASYTNTTEHLDGNEYLDCNFNNVLLVYSGGEPPKLVGCSFDGCNWKFEGAAERTLYFMGGLYHGGGKDLIEKTFDNIRTGR
jgi:hypothetical protein